MDENFDEQFRAIINGLGQLHQLAIDMKIYDTASAIHGAVVAAQQEYLRLKLHLN